MIKKQIALVACDIIGTPQPGSPMPRLSMVWSLDPINGKPVARWVCNSKERTFSKPWAPAA